MEEQEAKLLESPTWNHRKNDITPEPFLEYEGLDSNLKKLQSKNKKKKGDNINATTGKDMN